MKLALMEILSYLVVFGVWLFFRRILKRDITGDMLIGTVLGVFSEFASEPLCDYYFSLTFYKDIPVIIPVAWGMMYAITVFISEKLYTRLTRLPAIRPGDKRVLALDVFSGMLVGFPLETIGTWAGIWTYNYNVVNWTMPRIPVLNMPLEALIAYGLLMLTGPTIVRYWEGAFEGRS